MNERCFHCSEKHSLVLIEIYIVGNGPTYLHNVMQVLSDPQYGQPHLCFPTCRTTVVSLIKARGLFGLFLRCVYLVSWGFLTNCDQDLGLARSSRAGRSVHPSSSHQVWNTNRCLPHVIGTLWAWAGRAGCVCMLRAVTTAFCIWGKLMAHLGAVEKQQKKCGIFTSCFTSCDSKALILTGRALHLCCCTLHLLSDDS